MSSPKPAPLWNEQVAVISGGADGLGLAVARRLAARGVRLVLLDRNEEALAKAQTEFGTATITACVDVTDHAAVRGAIDAAAGTAQLQVVAGGGPGGLLHHLHLGQAVLGEEALLQGDDHR